MPSVLIAKEDGVALLDFDLRPEKAYVIGRSSAADVRLEAQSISRLHALLHMHDGEWRMADLGSTKGLRTENGTVRDHQLVHGGWVAIGPAIIWFFDERVEDDEFGGHSGEARARAAEPEQEQRMLQILLVQHCDTAEPQAVALARKSISIGSSDAFDVKIEHDDMEDIHLVILRIRGIWHAAAIGDTKLVDSDGTTARCAVLQTTTTLQAGALSLSLMEALWPPPAPGTSSTGTGTASGTAGRSRSDDPLDIDLGGLDEVDPHGKNGPPSSPRH